MRRTRHETTATPSGMGKKKPSRHGVSSNSNGLFECHGDNGTTPHDNERHTFGRQGIERPHQELTGSLLKFIRKNAIMLFVSLAMFASTSSVAVFFYSWQNDLSMLKTNSMIQKKPDRDIGSSTAAGHTLRDDYDIGTHQMAGDIMTPSFLSKAIDSCKAARDEVGEYPSIYRKLIPERIQRWDKQQKNGNINFLLMIKDKLGGYLYATKLGVRTPQILFCGVAKDLPKNMTSLGKNYVVKPLKGYSARGVKVVRDGVDILKSEKISYKKIIKEYGLEEETIVEELIESADPKFERLVPPDHKFYVYEGGMPELLLYIDRNEGQQCRDYFDISSQKMRFLEDLFDNNQGRGLMPHCIHDNRSKIVLEPSRQAALADAVQTLASSAGENWIRIDMFDSKDGPVLGEFTPFSHNGNVQPLVGCVMSYLFIAHAEHGDESTDDAEFISKREDVRELKKKLRMKKQTDLPIEHANVDFYPPEAREWLQYDELTKCKKVMEAQLELSLKDKTEI
mmetsp:Transcript_6609/g.14966  ORF Transcript_6609/g.14966 Transcript_6609/m.14966 type:complete len:509 (+) Transcript_6609:90-1616(+)